MAVVYSPLFKTLEVVVYSLLSNPKAAIKVVTAIKVVIVIPYPLLNNPKVVVRVLCLLFKNPKVAIRVVAKVAAKEVTAVRVAIRVVKVLCLRPPRLPKHRKSGRRTFEII